MTNTSAKKGFSTIEMLVATALFSAIMLMCVSAMVVLMDASYKARSVKTAMDNLGFVVEDMVRDLRLGSKYYCQTNANSTVNLALTGPVRDCAYEKTNSVLSGGEYLLFRDRANKAVSYRFANGCINKRVSSSNWTAGYQDDLSNYSCLTPSDITIDRFRFYVYNTSPTSNKQPYVVITAKVTVGSSARPKSQTSFSIQTTVSQRVPHNAE